LKNYNSVSFFGSEEYAQRMIDQYGVPNIMMVPEICEKAVKNRRGKIKYGDNSFDTIPELAFFLYVSDVYGSNRITVHPDNPFVYNYNGKTHKYWPDFNVDGIFIEIKGA